MKTAIRCWLFPLLVAGAGFGPSAATAFAGETPGRPAATTPRADDKSDGARDDKKTSAHKPALAGVVNLNTADAATLELLPQVGEKKAERILDYRHKHPFKKIEELTRVKGFGRKTFAKLKPYLTLAGPSTLGEGGGTPVE